MKQETEEIYGKMENEEYRNKISEMLDSIENEQILRYFYIFISEKIKRVSK